MTYLNVYSSVCKMQENNSESSNYILIKARASCAHEPCGKVSVLPDLQRKNNNKQGQAHKKKTNALFITPEIYKISHIHNRPI